MSQFTIQVPDGRQITIEAPNQATAIRGAQQYVSQNPAKAPVAGAQVGPSSSPAPQSNVIDAGNPMAQGKPEPAGPPQSIGDQLSAGFTSGVNALPIVGPSVLGALEKAKAGVQSLVYGPTTQDRVATSDANQVKANPVASTIGAVAGTALPFVVGGELPGVAKVLGMDASVPLMGRVAASAASNAGIFGADAAARGENPVTGALVGGAAGAAGPLIGAGLEAMGQGAAKAATEAAQAKITNTALKAAAPTTVADAKGAASDAFTAAYGPKTPMIAVQPDSYNKFMSSVAQSVQKLRPNPANDPQAVGLLQHLTDLGKSASTPGTVVDLQDLHLARQLAGKVAQSGTGRDATIGGIVTRQIDNFVQNLKPADILGGADPSVAAGNLLKGISGWARASRMGVIQTAIDKAQGYASGVENGLKLTFGALIKDTANFNKFTPAEQQAITQVAKGTSLQNFASLFGKMGLSLGGHGAHNILGAGVGTTGLTAALTPFLGPAAFPAALTATTAAGAVGRTVAENAAKASADRALRVFGTEGIPIAAKAPNLLRPPPTGINLLTRTSPEWAFGQ